MSRILFEYELPVLRGLSNIVILILLANISLSSFVLFTLILMRYFKLNIATTAATWAVASVCQQLPIAGDLLDELCPRAAYHVERFAETLAEASNIYFPGSEAFEVATTRWSNLDLPTINVVVAPSTEEDVAQTVSSSHEPIYRLRVLMRIQGQVCE